MRRLLALLISTFFCLGISAQKEVDFDLLRDYYEGSSEDLQECYDKLEELSVKPLDINDVTITDLQQIPLLDAEQINDLIEYRDKHYPIRTMEELGMIESVDRRLRLLLSSVLCVGKAATMNGGDDKSRLRHNVTLTAKIPTYYRAGDQSAPAKTAWGKNTYAGRYLGDPVQHSLRYSLKIGNHIDVNMSGSKQAGEPFFSNGNDWGYDRYRLNASISNQGRLYHAVVGHFRGSFGMGLVLNTGGFSLGKEALSGTAAIRSSYFTAHNGGSDSKYFQGIAATVGLTDAITVASFVSYRKIDATLNKDSTVSSVLTSYYHRTQTEMNKHNNTTQFAAGAHVTYNIGKHLTLGVSGLYTSYNRELNPTYTTSAAQTAQKEYRTYYPHGSKFWNVGIDYHLHLNKLSLSGETATGDCGNIATVNRVQWSVGRVDLLAVQRYYAYQFYSIYGSSFSEGGRVQNESGIYLGAKWNAGKNIVVSGYTDISYFPWLKYQVSNSSYVWDNRVTGEWSNDSWSVAMRYKIKLRQKDKKQEDGTKALANKLDQRLRITVGFTNERWSAKTQLEGCIINNDETSSGFIFSQTGQWKALKWLTVSGSAAYFNTKDYESRQYVYERTVRYAFGFGSYYGHGIRASLFAKVQPLAWLSVQAKAGHTRYFDRDTIGTADRMIFSSYQTDFDVQLTVKI